jgi:hypothetical protein
VLSHREEDGVLALQLCPQERYLILHDLEGYGLWHRMVDRIITVRTAIWLASIP